MSNGQLSRAARYGRTKRKAVTLTVSGLAEIETLAMMGMNRAAADALPRLLVRQGEPAAVAAVEWGCRRQ